MPESTNLDAGAASLNAIALAHACSLCERDSTRIGSLAAILDIKLHWDTARVPRLLFPHGSLAE